MKGRCKQNESGEKGSGGLLLRRWMISRQIVENLFKICLKYMVCILPNRLKYGIKGLYL